jgi:hypothetical protein
MELDLTTFPIRILKYPRFFGNFEIRQNPYMFQNLMKDMQHEIVLRDFKRQLEFIYGAFKNQIKEKVHF